MAIVALELGQRMACDLSVDAGDWVYVRPDMKAAKAKADSDTTMPSVGFVSFKEASDICFVKDEGPYSRSGVSFTPGLRSFISTLVAGRTTEVEPGLGQVLQIVGVGSVDPDTLLVRMQLPAKMIAGGEAQPRFISRPFAPGVVVNDLVYQRSDGLVDKASATSIVTMPALGFVAVLNAPSPGLCLIQRAGDLDGFVGISIGAIYIVSLDSGKFLRDDAASDPNYPDNPGNIVQEVAIGASAVKLLVGSDRDFLEV